MDSKQAQAALLAVVLIGAGILLVMGNSGMLWGPGNDRTSIPPIVIPGEERRGEPPLEVPHPRKVPTAPAGPGSYLFCFWNVENLFDDQDDNRTTRGDKEYDEWFSHDQVALKQKLTNLTEVLLGLNAGKGPDILCVAEIESRRAGELLQLALNRRLPPDVAPYSSVIYESPGGGRNIGTAILTRLPVASERGHLIGSRLRILEGRIEVAGQPLVVIASHWSSRISDKTGKTRGHYGDAIHKRFEQIWKSDPSVDLIVCGDFNDDPDEPSVTEHLRAIGDASAVREARGDPLLFNLFARLAKEGKFSHHYQKGYLFDQICVSPAMLDPKGWSCEVQSADVVKEMATRQGTPNRFGGEKDRRPLEVRGASDHFPVTVRLRVR